MYKSVWIQARTFHRISCFKTSRSFDTLDHSILLTKLKYYGVTGCSYDLLSSYLTGRSQYVELSGHKSNTLPISTRVPLVSNIFDMLMYADDTTLYCNINAEVINGELLKINQ